MSGAKNKAPEGRARGGKAMTSKLRMMGRRKGAMLGESAGYATSRQAPKRFRNHHDTPSPHVASKGLAREAPIIRELRP